MVSSNLFERFIDQGLDPDTDVGCHDVHETEARYNFEAVDVQLGK